MWTSSLFLFAIYSLDTPQLKFDHALWTATVDHVTVHTDGKLVFKFHNGAEIAEPLKAEKRSSIDFMDDLSHRLYT